MSTNIYYFRQSHLALIYRLVIFETLIFFLYLTVRIPKALLIYTEINFPLIADLNWASILYFMFLSFIQLVGIVLITFGWSNEVYEIKEGMVIHRRGVFRLREDSYSLKSVGSATIVQDFIGKLFNFGTIKVYSPILKQEFFLINVHNPKKKVKLLEKELIGPRRDRIIPKRH